MFLHFTQWFSMQLWTNCALISILSFNFPNIFTTNVFQILQTTKIRNGSHILGLISLYIDLCIYTDVFLYNSICICVESIYNVGYTVNVYKTILYTHWPTQHICTYATAVCATSTPRQTDKSHHALLVDHETSLATSQHSNLLKYFCLRFPVLCLNSVGACLCATIRLFLRL